MYYDYHYSNGLLPKFLCKQQARHSFCNVSLTFPVILSFFLLIFENQSAVGKVIQLGHDTLMANFL